jgi:tetratricopeptide (TPR) repeat protein
MSKVDQFESVFRSALHDVFDYAAIKFKKILIISDLENAECSKFEETIKVFSKKLDIASDVSWLSLKKDDYDNSQKLLDKIATLDPDLIFTYRNLRSSAWQYCHSLGEYLDVLIQKTDIPVVVVPHPLEKDIKDYVLKNTDKVMAVTDHLSADNDLVNYAVQFTEKQGELYLMHIEDANTFDYYMNVISKISTIDTNDAQDEISKQLLKAPKDYINSVKSILQQEKLSISIHDIIGFGHHLTEYRKYIDEYNIDLLVLNTKDKEQMAMHGLAYPLVVELRSIPLLLI